jgi:hypothetical protein
MAQYLDPCFQVSCSLQIEVRNYENLDRRARTLSSMYKFSCAGDRIVGQKSMEHALAEEGELMCS